MEEISCLLVSESFFAVTAIYAADAGIGVSGCYKPLKPESCIGI
jgi:hypothetical protein